MIERFKAPWSKSIIAISCLVPVFLVTIAVLERQRSATFGVIFPLAVLGGAALFTIRGYAVTPDAVLIRRLLWSTRFPRAGLVSATFQPNVVERSMRLFGNGGLFAASGLFRNRRLGNYRAFLTDPSRSVVLQYPNRTIVVSPDNPERFVQALSAR